jgi:hypothetical protein
VITKVVQIFCPEDGGNIFPRNTDNHRHYYMTPQHTSPKAEITTGDNVPSGFKINYLIQNIRVGTNEHNTQARGRNVKSAVS